VIRVALEAGAKRVFAVAVDWPGWARSGRDEEAALLALAEHAPRYAAAVGEPGLLEDAGYDVVERLSGGSGTDFGVPSAELPDETRPLTGEELARARRILEAAWAAFDTAAAAAAGKQLRTGPRGGGRSVEKMTDHVLEAEEAYLTQLGRRRPKPPEPEPAARMRQVREAALATLAALARGNEPDDPSGVRRRWPPRYFVRRSAWHALDHAWELEDRLV
jgi:DinB superfamily